jgi:hypothetical protein
MVRTLETQLGGGGAPAAAHAEAPSPAPAPASRSQGLFMETYSTEIGGLGIPPADLFNIRKVFSNGKLSDEDMEQDLKVFMPTESVEIFKGLPFSKTLVDLKTWQFLNMILDENNPDKEWYNK